MPGPSGPTADTHADVEIVEVVPTGARPANDNAMPPRGAQEPPPDLGLGGLTGEESAGHGGVCGDPGCPYCESVKVCPATGQRYTPVSREAAQVISSVVGPILSRVPYRGIDAAKVPKGHLELSEREQRGLDEAMWLFLRKRGHMLGPIDDVLALAAAATLIVAPRAMEAAQIRGEG